MTKLNPLADRVVVKATVEENKTKGGIILPDTVSKEKPQEGSVIAVGPGKLLDDGSRSTMEVKINDKIIFSKYAGTEIKIDDVEYLIIAERDILAIIEG
ncbi:MAG: co-chaperone GroES [Candidatus Wallbacteria bacterium HGW-Wallbacteria-1]|jgi:chaperonin GroES|uniref:Co-chaperonin GroES n=1 Tax=Candidatus Wallbacteria bacterium HGW-Wallbacteria-1 TaxID=2013854 RepID=A0A2N1PQI3_9BACT|nr:MAG: co-chaperone GroES [Candidatus Wallbacteria bacterium HGW-Wallbacteria-1]